MHPYPHRYTVNVAAAPEGEVSLSSEGLTPLASTPPPEFDGPPGYWSPETLLTAAAADCFVLSFRAVSRASKFEWTSISATVEGTLDRVDGVTRFVAMHTKAKLSLPAGADAARGQALLEKAEKICLISNSLNAERHLEAEVVVG